MEIVAKNLLGLDLNILISLVRELSLEEVEIIEDSAKAWCLVALSGAFDEPLHNFTQPGYDKNKGCVVFHADIGSMNPEKGFELLEKICDGLNKYTFREEVIKQIELDGGIG